MEPEVKVVEEVVAEQEVKPGQEKRAEVAVEKNGRKYQLLLPMDASIGEAYEAAFVLLLRVIEIAKENAEKMRPQPPKEDAAVEPEVVEETK